MNVDSPGSLVLIGISLLLGATGCFDCDLAEITAGVVSADATSCGDDTTREDVEVDWQCFYSAITDGYAAWVVYEAEPDTKHHPGNPFSPRVLASGLAYDGTERVWSHRHLQLCSDYGVEGPCIYSLSAVATGDLNDAPGEPDGAGRINIEEDGIEEGVSCH